MDLRATWLQSIGTFLLPILLVLGARWLLVEPYVIPSGSMLPSLLIHDHIFVNKLSYGLQNPFTGQMIWSWNQPERGDVFVFRYPENPKVFFVKRMMGLPGDSIEIRDGILFINQQAVPSREMDKTEQDWVSLPDEDDFMYLRESLGKSYSVRWRKDMVTQFGPVQVPAGHYFAMGDNRNQSHDSRFWGFVPEKYLIGRAQLIWLSCESMLESAPFLCQPASIRWNRVLKSVQ